jgi:pyrrolidone-carboxylate peptidase
VDVDGRSPREFSRPGARLETIVPLARLLARLHGRGLAEVRISHTAGGYVCEHLYHHLLARAAERGVPGLFVHVPPLRFTPLERQLEVLRAILAELAPRAPRPRRYSASSASRG